MKPFNLEAALAGAPVVTRDGREVTQLVKFDTSFGIRLLGVRDGTIAEWYQDGTTSNGRKDGDYDLFMAPVKKTGWVVRYSDGYPPYMARSLFATREEAMKVCDGAASFHEISWEE